MKQRLKVYDYATQMQISMSTVYRQIKAGKIESETIDGVLYVLLNEEQMQRFEEQNNIVAELRKRLEHQEAEIEFLRDRLEQAEQDRQRSDTIIMQLTQQLDRAHLQLEDMRHRSIWRRLKEVFATEAV